MAVHKKEIEVLTDLSDLFGRALVSFCFFFKRLTSWFRNYTIDASLQSLLLQEEAVLVPDEVRYLGVKLVALHAALKQAIDVLVVRVRRERQSSAIVHVLLEFRGLVEAELVNRHFLLFALDVVIFFVL